MTKAKGTASQPEGQKASYELRDGKYYLGVAYRERFEQMFAERAGLASLTTSIVERLKQEHAKVSRMEKQIWLDLRRDLGLPMSKYFTYDGEGCVYEKEAPEGAS